MKCQLLDNMVGGLVGTASDDPRYVYETGGRVHQRQEGCPAKGKEEVMNELNYASREASKRLMDAGIVLKTEAYWLEIAGRWEVHHAKYFYIDLRNSVPAPSMAEVWRELPESVELGKFHTTNSAYFDGKRFDNTNPTDALIDLLIWVKKEVKR